MLMILSPAKTLDFSRDIACAKRSEPRMKGRAEELVSILREMDKGDLQSLMKMSDKLADQTYQRFLDFGKDRGEGRCPALAAFRGEVYNGLDAVTLDAEDIRFSSIHLRVLSGLYGVLRPCDMIYAYRLEMGTRLITSKGKNLYQYWGDAITEWINEDIKKSGSAVLLNLASKEYYKSINTKKLEAEVVDVDFREFRGGALKFVTIYAKKARGLMARYILKHKINTIEGIKGFDVEGYSYYGGGQGDGPLVFVRG